MSKKNVAIPEDLYNRIQRAARKSGIKINHLTAMMIESAFQSKRIMLSVELDDSVPKDDESNKKDDEKKHETYEDDDGDEEWADYDDD